MKHDELQNDLATHLRANTSRMVWTNTQLGPSGSPRPDVFSVDKSYARFNADAYEIKVSVSDLRRDVTSGKWQSYRKFAHRVWFAFPKGLVPLSEIPRECGVIVRSESGWRAARKPIAQILETLPHDAWMKLLIESFPSHGHDLAPRRADHWRQSEMLRKKLGDEAAQLFSRKGNARTLYEAAVLRQEGLTDEINQDIRRRKDDADKLAKQDRARLDEEHAYLAAVLGLPANTSAKDLANRLRAIAWQLDAKVIDRAIRELEKLKTVFEPQSPAVVSYG